VTLLRVARGLALALGLLASGAAHASDQVFIEGELLWTFGGRGHFGLGLGGHYSYVRDSWPFAPDMGAFARVRWSRLSSLTAAAGARLGAVVANEGGGAYRPIVGANLDFGYALRTHGGPGMLLGGGGYASFVQARFDTLLFTRQRPTPAAVAAGESPPLPSWQGRGDHDPTLSVGAQAWVMPRNYALTMEDSPPEPMPMETTGTTGTTVE
jgi:hypothetical protein